MSLSDNTQANPQGKARGNVAGQGGVGTASGTTGTQPGVPHQEHGHKRGDSDPKALSATCHVAPQILPRKHLFWSSSDGDTMPSYKYYGDTMWGAPEGPAPTLHLPGPAQPLPQGPVAVARTSRLLSQVLGGHFPSRETPQQFFLSPKEWP